MSAGSVNGGEYLKEEDGGVELVQLDEEARAVGRNQPGRGSEATQ